jgi:hypothetical protein
VDRGQKVFEKHRLVYVVVASGLAARMSIQNLVIEFYYFSRNLYFSLNLNGLYAANYKLLLVACHPEEAGGPWCKLIAIHILECFRSWN